MIKAKNMGHFVLPASVPGTLTAAADKAAVVVPCGGYLCGILASTSAKGTKPEDATTNVVVDINKNGTTIFANAAKLIFDGATATAKSVDDLASNPFPVAAGDVLSVDIDSLFNGTGPTQPKNLAIQFLMCRKGSAPTALLKGDFQLD